MANEKERQRALCAQPEEDVVVEEQPRQALVVEDDAMAPAVLAPPSPGTGSSPTGLRLGARRMDEEEEESPDWKSDGDDHDGYGNLKGPDSTWSLPWQLQTSSRNDSKEELPEPAADSGEASNASSFIGPAWHCEACWSPSPPLCLNCVRLCSRVRSRTKSW